MAGFACRSGGFLLGKCQMTERILKSARRKKKRRPIQSVHDERKVLLSQKIFNEYSNTGFENAIFRLTTFFQNAIMNTKKEGIQNGKKVV